MIFSIRELGGSNTLAGAQSGRRTLAALIERASTQTRPEIAFLDFNGVAVATSSFLREAVLKFRDYTRSTLPNLYPAVANASPAVIEELAFYVDSIGDALWCCELDTQGEPTRSWIIGVLDPAQRETFELVKYHGSATAPQLAADRPNDGIKATAWNNRLAALVEKGLLVEERSGKTKSFAPLLRMV